MPAPVCSICTHPARVEIDELLLDGETQLEEIRDWLAANHAASGVPTASTLSRHRSKHLARALKAESGAAITVNERGQLVDASGKIIERVAVLDALNIIITLGAARLLAHPELIGPRELIDAAKLLKAIGQASGELGDFMDEWGKVVKRPRRRKSRAAEAEVIDVTPDDEGWPDLGEFPRLGPGDE
jgi:hypothetical protein